MIEKNWGVFRSLFSKHRKKRSRSIKENQEESFFLKYINRALPTLEKRKTQRPDLYSISTCVKCEQSEETFEHLTSCEKDIEEWRTEERNILKEIWKGLNSEDKNILSLDDLLHTILPSSFHEVQWRIRLSRGFVELRHTKELQVFGLSKYKAKRILSDFLEK